MTIRLFIDKETDLEMSNGLLEPIKLNTLLFKVNDFLVLKRFINIHHAYALSKDSAVIIPGDPSLCWKEVTNGGKSHVNH